MCKDETWAVFFAMPLVTHKEHAYGSPGKCEMNSGPGDTLERATVSTLYL